MEVFHIKTDSIYETDLQQDFGNLKAVKTFTVNHFTRHIGDLGLGKAINLVDISVANKDEGFAFSKKYVYDDEDKNPLYTSTQEIVRAINDRTVTYLKITYSFDIGSSIVERDCDEGLLTDFADYLKLNIEYNYLINPQNYTDIIQDNEITERKINQKSNETIFKVRNSTNFQTETYLSNGIFVNNLKINKNNLSVDIYCHLEEKITSDLKIPTILNFTVSPILTYYTKEDTESEDTESEEDVVTLQSTVLSSDENIPLIETVAQKVYKNFKNPVFVIKLLCSMGGNIQKSAELNIHEVFSAPHNNFIIDKYQNDKDVPLVTAQSGEYLLSNLKSSKIVYDGALWQGLSFETAGQTYSFPVADRLPVPTANFPIEVNFIYLNFPSSLRMTIYDIWEIKKEVEYSEEKIYIYFKCYSHSSLVHNKPTIKYETTTGDSAKIIETDGVGKDANGNIIYGFILKAAEDTAWGQLIYQ